MSSGQNETPGRRNTKGSTSAEAKNKTRLAALAPGENIKEKQVQFQLILSLRSISLLFINVLRNPRFLPSKSVELNFWNFLPLKGHNPYRLDFKRLCTVFSLW